MGKNSKIASNGAVMRTTPVGCFCFWDEECVAKAAENLSKVTHYDPKCAYSSVLISLIISRLIKSKSSPNYKFDLDKTIEDAFTFVEGSNEERDEIMKYLSVKEIEELDLENRDYMGYTLRTTGSAIWALRYTNSITEAIEKVIREGGDSDTNGAVVGGVLGAKYGFSQLPKDILTYMFNGQWLYNEVDPFMRIMGIEPPPSFWKK